MNKVVKPVLIALGLLAGCIALLAGVKSYGVWVISAMAAVLFVIGMMGREKPKESGSGSKTPDAADDKSGPGDPKPKGNDGT
jgi:hypothetical protein